MTTPRQDARDIFNYALKACDIAAAMKKFVRFHRGVMQVDEHRYVLKEYEHCVLIAIGKAAGTMSTIFLRLAGRQADRFEGVVVSPNQEPVWSYKFSYYRGGHPIPDGQSLAAAKAILETLVPLTAEDLVVFLISGGGSALAVRFIEQVASLEIVAATHKALVESGAPIAAMNAIRKHLSATKGGRLAAAAAPAEQVTIFVSDVPEGKLDALSSGPTMPDSSTLEDVRRTIDEYGLAERLPAEAVKLLQSDDVHETPKPGDSIFDRSRWTVMLDSGSLERAAVVRATKLDWKVEMDHACDDWPAEKAAQYLVDRVRKLRQELGRVCLISAGELTVRLPISGAGTGGRNQQFALLCSELIAGDSITVLSCGSDGIDGNSPAAGAIVDGKTVERAAVAGLSVRQAIETFDSYPLLNRLRSVVVTGPTGNNLRDLRILLAS
jgi:glycerate 2-kinase